MERESERKARTLDIEHRNEKCHHREEDSSVDEPARRFPHERVEEAQRRLALLARHVARAHEEVRGDEEARHEVGDCGSSDQACETCQREHTPARMANPKLCFAKRLLSIMGNATAVVGRVSEE